MNDPTEFQSLVKRVLTETPMTAKEIAEKTGGSVMMVRKEAERNHHQAPRLIIEGVILKNNFYALFRTKIRWPGIFAAVTLVPFGTGWLMTVLFPDVLRRSLIVTTPFHLWVGNMWMLGLWIWMTLFYIYLAIYVILILMASIGLLKVIAGGVTRAMRFWNSIN
ncbi:hypothetical protein [Acidithiobacillus ferrianus]|uniref:hypothetical protein n=1 Tax=Acidithiobacillus ferrianus TaxID=2678518 RepID=UPI0034E3F761